MTLSLTTQTTKVGINDADFGTATSTAHAATVNHTSGQIITESVSTAAGSDYTFTLTNSCIGAQSNVVVTFAYAGTIGTNGIPVLLTVTPAAGSATIVIANIHASNALSGTLLINFSVL